MNKFIQKIVRPSTRTQKTPDAVTLKAIEDAVNRAVAQVQNFIPRPPRCNHQWALVGFQRPSSATTWSVSGILEDGSELRITRHETGLRAEPSTFIAVMGDNMCYAYVWRCSECSCVRPTTVFDLLAQGISVGDMKALTPAQGEDDWLADVIK